MTYEEFEAKKTKVVKVCCFVFGGACLVLSGVCLYKVGQMRRIMNKAVSSVSELTSVDVSQNIVEKAVTSATEREVGKVVSKAVEDVKNSMNADVRNRVKQAVQNSYPNLRKTVTDAIAKEASKIDRSEIMDEAVEKAKELLVERFDGQLDSLLDEHNRNLENVAKIYQSIADAMTQKSGKDINLKIS